MSGLQAHARQRQQGTTGAAGGPGSTSAHHYDHHNHTAAAQSIPPSSSPERQEHRRQHQHHHHYQQQRQRPQQQQQQHAYRGGGGGVGGGGLFGTFMSKVTGVSGSVSGATSGGNASVAVDTSDSCRAKTSSGDGGGGVEHGGHLQQQQQQQQQQDRHDQHPNQQQLQSQHPKKKRPEQQQSGSGGSGSAEALASVLPIPGQAGPTAFAFSPDPMNRYLAFLSGPNQTVASNAAGVGGSVPPASTSSKSSSSKSSSSSLSSSSWAKQLQRRYSGKKVSEGGSSSTAHGGGTAVGAQHTSSSSSSERRLCAVDMLPFLRRHGIAPYAGGVKGVGAGGVGVGVGVRGKEVSGGSDDSDAVMEVGRRDDDATVGDGVGTNSSGCRVALHRMPSTSGDDEDDDEDDDYSEGYFDGDRCCGVVGGDEDDMSITYYRDGNGVGVGVGVGGGRRGGRNGGGGVEGRGDDDGLSSPEEQAQVQPITDPEVMSREHVFLLLATGSGGRGKIAAPSAASNGSSCEVTLESEPEAALSLEERLRRERQRVHSSGVTQFSWTTTYSDLATEPAPEQTPPFREAKAELRKGTAKSTRAQRQQLRILVPLRGNIYVQDGIGGTGVDSGVSPGPRSPSPPRLRCVYDKATLESAVRRGHGRGQQNGESAGGRGARSGVPGDYNPAVGRDASAIDPQLSPDGSMVAFVVAGEIYVTSADSPGVGSSAGGDPSPSVPVRLTYGAMHDDEDDHDGEGSVHDYRAGNRCITHGLADFVSQEEMDRYRGYWWTPSSDGIVFTRVDESMVPPYRIAHQGACFSEGSEGGVFGEDGVLFEDHRYPFAGQNNPSVQLGYIPMPSHLLSRSRGVVGGVGVGGNDRVDNVAHNQRPRRQRQYHNLQPRQAARTNFHTGVRWFQPPHNANEYLARVSFLPDGSVCAQWQNRSQSTLVLLRIDVASGRSTVLLTERSDVWINLHHLLQPLARVYPPEGYSRNSLPNGSFSFLFGSERTGFCHLYLYTYIPGASHVNSNSDGSSGGVARLVRAVSAGDWMVESIAGVYLDDDEENGIDVVYVTGTYDSPLERHLYSLPIRGHNADSTSSSSTPSYSRGRRMGADEGAATSTASANEHVRTSKASRLQHAALSSARGWAGVGSTGSKPGVGDLDSPWTTASVGTDACAPIRLTNEPGMHNIIMDAACRIIVDSSSDLTRPGSVKVYTMPAGAPFSRTREDASSTCRDGTHHEDNKYSKRDFLSLVFVLHDASLHDATGSLGGVGSSGIGSAFPPPELVTFRSSDDTVDLHAALYLPDKELHGPGPYPLACAVYGGPHVQHVHRSYSQCTDMRAQRLRSLGFAVVKCDNRGSSRRGLSFEGAIRRRLGRLEVLDQVAAVRHLIRRGIADSDRVGIYGWSYGGYLALMCLCRAPDVFHVAVAGAPVTSWDGYDTHYTERYMGTPQDNTSGYRESAIFDHVGNMKGRLMLVHGLIDENVHFRHTARLINRLIAAGKDYDLLLFPDERHSPRRVRDRIYMEQRISDFFVKYLMPQKHHGQAAAFHRDGKNVGLGSSSHPGSSGGGGGGGGGGGAGGFNLPASDQYRPTRGNL